MQSKGKRDARPARSALKSKVSFMSGLEAQQTSGLSTQPSGRQNSLSPSRQDRSETARPVHGRL